jgi:hypothetical protein
VDFQIQVVKRDGTIQTYLVEIKPAAQTLPPIYPGRKTQRYLTESMTYVKNRAKWEAAERYALDRGWEFKIITEHELGLK